MKKIIKVLLIGLLLIPFLSMARSTDVYRVEVGSNYQKYTNAELRQRVWKLERAVSQLQDQVFQLAMNKDKPKVDAAKEKWNCFLKSYGKTFTSAGRSKSQALGRVLKKCSDNSNAAHCRKDEAECSDK